jgi:RsiW-degrading membrane proteinase PrsW (M82 family)
VNRREEINGGDLSQEPALSPAASGGTDRERLEHSVWEEPHLPPRHPGAQTPYARAYSEKIHTTTSLSSWGTTLGAALVGGPLGVLGAFLYGFGPLGPFVWGPTAEEVLKIGAIAMVVETRPYLIRHGYQIVIAAALSAFAFAVIENLLYLNVYLPEHSELLAGWRWNFASLLHVSASLVASLGLVKIWRDSRTDLTRPQFTRALGYLIAAIIIHGGYNVAVTIWEKGWSPF